MDENGNHIEDVLDEIGNTIETNWGICDDWENCYIDQNGKLLTNSVEIS